MLLEQPVVRLEQLLEARDALGLLLRRQPAPTVQDPKNERRVSIGSGRGASLRAVLWEEFERASGAPQVAVGVPLERLGAKRGLELGGRRRRPLAVARG